MARETSSFPASIAIIGASISGLSLALALLHARIFRPENITIYDLRHAPSQGDPSSVGQSGFDPSTTASGVILTPNGLSVLSELGVLQRIKSRCWTATHRTFRSDPGDVLVKKVRISGEEAGYGFENHRVWRSVLVEELLDMVREAHVAVRWGCKFERMLNDTSEKDAQNTATNGRVHFEISQKGSAADERVKSLAEADMLVGADGIYSAVRKNLDSEARPVYTGTTGVLAHIRWDDVEWPQVSDSSAQTSSADSADALSMHDYERQCTLQGQPGALFWLPEDAQGSVVMIGKQTRMPEPELKEGMKSAREAWEALSQDTTFVCEFYQHGYQQWGETGRKIIDAVCDEKRGRETLYLWPFMKMEKLERWWKAISGSTNTSTPGIALILGDAAHALPPSSGQGVNQTLEDVWVLSQLLNVVKDGVTSKSLDQALQFWQESRQDRIDDVYDWATNATNVSRLPKAEREKEQATGSEKGNRNGDDMSWLYRPNWEQTIDTWSKSQFEDNAL